MGFFLAFLCRLQMDEELRQREREREREREKEREREADREREKEREREREREKELEREREKERERELERQRERAREKELSMVKAMEGPFLPVAELHGLRGHPAEERGKPVEPLVPSRAGNVPMGDAGGDAALGAACHKSPFPSRWQSRGGQWHREVARDGAGLSRLPARCAKSPAAAAPGEAARAVPVPSDSVRGGDAPGAAARLAAGLAASRQPPNPAWAGMLGGGGTPCAPQNTLIANDGRG